MKMLPRLHAQEQLSAIETVGLGSGSYEAHDSRAMLERLRQAANEGQEGRRVRKADHAQLAAMGIGVKVAASPEAQNDV
ncbi:hypothetical protein SAMN02927924_01701 [Sphingobium faniae]|nr:hypothetical protein SAMN02927924_01701 [Sphingobium faniae]